MPWFTIIYVYIQSNVKAFNCHMGSQVVPVYSTVKSCPKKVMPLRLRAYAPRRILAFKTLFKSNAIILPLL